MKWFNRNEMKCNCGKCGQDVVDYELAEVLDDVREYFGKPVTITSGNRCLEYNISIGGSNKSVHMTGQAADIQVKGTKPNKVQEYLLGKYPGKYGIGRYSNFSHIDVKTGPARRWDSR